MVHQTLLGRRVASVGLLLSLTTGAWLSAAGEDSTRPKSIAELLNRVFRTANSLQSQSYRVVQTDSLGRVSELRYVRDGARFRIDRHDLSGNVIGQESLDPMRFSVSFDGEGFQHVAHANKKLVRSSSRRTMGANDPFLTCYKWLTASRCHKTAWSALSSQAQWSECFEVALLVSQDDQHMVVDFPHVCIGKGFVFRVHFSVAHQFFPERVQYLNTESKRVGSEPVARDFVEYESNGSTYSFPSYVEFEQFGEEGESLSIRSQYEIQRESIELNQPVTDDVFDLAQDTEVVFTLDVDKNKQRHQEILEAKAKLEAERPRPSGSGKLILVALNVAIASAAVWFLWKRGDSQ